MSVVVYRSTDSGAPVLSGTAGNGIPNLFDVCLVGSGTAYGSKPKMGWTKLYSGTHKGVYVSVDGVFHLRVMHDGSNTGGFREALVRAAEGATDVDTLVDPFPSTSDVAAGSETWRISDTLDSTARAWVLVAGPDFVMLNVWFGTTSSDLYIAGKYSPASPSNAWPYLINTRNVSNNNGGNLACTMAVSTAVNYTGTGYRLYAMRTPNGVSKGPRALFATSSSASTNATQPGSVGAPCPNADGEILFTPPELWVNGVAGSGANSQQFAGYMPQLYSPLHNFNAAGTTAALGDTFSSPGHAVGAEFQLLGAASSSLGKWIVETSDTWADPLA